METPSTLANTASHVMRQIVVGEPSTVEDEAACQLFVDVADRLSLTRGGVRLLDRFEEHPHDSAAFGALRHAIRRHAENDDIFAATLRRAIRQLRSRGEPGDTRASRPRPDIEIGAVAGHRHRADPRPRPGHRSSPRRLSIVLGAPTVGGARIPRT